MDLGSPVGLGSSPYSIGFAIVIYLWCILLNPGSALLLHVTHLLAVLTRDGLLLLGPQEKQPVTPRLSKGRLPFWKGMALVVYYS